jgi:diguanylate cyclase (GGDEF)-like protein/PAS domain S-box-containing protein
MMIGGTALIVVQHRWPTPVGGFGHNAVQVFASCSMMWGVVIGLRGQPRLERWSITAFAAIKLGLQLYWTFTGAISGPSGPHSWADQVNLVGVGIGVVGLLVLSTRGMARRSWLRVASDTALVASALMATAWTVLFSDLELHHATEGGILALIMTPAGDIIAAALILVVAVHQPERRYLRWLSAAVFIWTISDLVSAYHRGHGFGSNHLIVLGAWFLGPLMIGITARLMEVSPPSFAISSTRRIWAYAPVALAIGSIMWVLARRGSLDAASLWVGLVMGFFIVVNQITSTLEVRELLNANETSTALLTLSEQRFRLAFEGSPVGIAVVENGIITDANPLIASLIGRKRCELIGREPGELVSSSEIPEVQPADWRALTETTDSLDIEFEVVHDDGSTHTLAATVARAESANSSIIIAQDVTERRADTARLAHIARHDQLTGLPNREAFLDTANAALTDRSGQGVSIAFLDLDRFKVVNDSLGHAVGDQILTTAARRIATAIGADGFVARFAGDEFTILLPDIRRSEALEALERVRVELVAPIELGQGASIYPTASIGAVWFASGTGDCERALMQADAAMYRAKALGRNRVEVFDARSSDASGGELRIVGELHRAAANHELRAHYQPIIEVESGLTVGFEALMRWQHPTRGLLPPSEFMDAAESSGLIVELGEWILREALGQLVTWQRAAGTRPLTMSINMAARQITDEYADLVDEVLLSTGLDPDTVWLEITETAMMSDALTAEGVLHRLAGMGLHLTVDDFGTGYSSLTHLLRFPVDGIKVDRSFTQGLGQNRQADAICEGIISLAKALGLKTVAEGVEHRTQLERLRELGCPLAQGYLFSRPQPAEEIAQVHGFMTSPFIPARAR